MRTELTIVSCLIESQAFDTQFMPFHYQLTMATTFRIKSTVRGHHVYKAVWSPYIGEELPVQHEVNSIHDDFAVAVLKNGKNSNTVGHVPREISRVCWYFLHKSGSEMTCIVSGDRRRSEVDGKGLVVPCVYIFRGKQKTPWQTDKPVC